MNKRFVRVFMIMMMILAVFSGPVFASTALSGTVLASTALDVKILYDEAILYTIDENDVLEFNVIRSADVSNAEIVDKTSSGIETLAELKEVMGVRDAPARVFGTDTEGRTLGKAVTADLTLDKHNKIVNLTITNIRERPVVGIAWKSSRGINSFVGNAEAFERNGALAVFLPQITNAEEARDQLSKVHGVFLTGGEDWNPALYNEGQTPHGSVSWNDARDTSEMNLMQQAISMDVPQLGVCRGEQGLNVSLGGGLIQDVPYYLGQKVLAGEIDPSRVTGELEDTGYRKWNPVTEVFDRVTCEDDKHYRVQIDGVKHSVGGYSYHSIEAGENIGILKSSKWLYDILGTDSLEFVATAHHQSVNPEKLGKGITIAAYSSDGIVEAIEHQDSLFALGVQWHPELDALRTSNPDYDQDFSNALMGALVKYAGTYKDIKDAPPSSGSSSGCNTGLLAILILTITVLVIKKLDRKFSK